ncbi:hypothetical protein [Microvirga sp. G4-2]|uniref:hypothetical protein n=1 Tax=Microvirga sp. G4-2 TaxID=3434467 RepID=UPI004043D5F9
MSSHKTRCSSGKAFHFTGVKEENGFVLLSVLLVTSVISALALGAAVIARSYLRSADIEVRAISARALADAGLTRIVAALEDVDDQLGASLRVSPTPWIYAGTELLLEVEFEAGKVDLNSGDGELVQSVMRAVVKDGLLANHVLERWMEFRRRGQEIETIDVLLDPRQRFASLAADLERHFTTISGARGFDPIVASDVVLHHVPGIAEADLRQIEDMRQGRTGKGDLPAIKRRYQPLLDGERPLYRIRSTISLPNQLTVRREALAARNDDTGTMHIIFWRDHVERAPVSLPQ